LAGEGEKSEASVGPVSENGEVSSLSGQPDSEGDEVSETAASQVSTDVETQRPEDLEPNQNESSAQEPERSPAGNDETDSTGSADVQPDMPDFILTAKDSDRMILVPYDVQADEGFSATFQLSSLPESKVSAQLKVYSHGTGLDTSSGDARADGVLSVGLPGNGSIRVTPDSSGDSLDNRILLALDSAAGELTADEHPEADEYDFMPNILQDEPSTRLATPIEICSSFRTTLVCGNPTESPVMVRLYLIDDNGKKMDSLSDPRLNPLPPNRQIALGAEEIFGTLGKKESFRGSIVSEVMGEGLIQSVGLDCTESGSSLFRRALNMNIDLEGLKTDIAQELGELVKREEHLKEQMLHLEAVLRFVGDKQAVVSASDGFNLGPNPQGQEATSQAQALGA
jgi:hypothetical protein